MSLDLEPAVLPLHPDAAGVVRIGATRVTLESVLHAYLEGESAEGIVERFPTLDLADVHATVAWFLRHRSGAEAYLDQCRQECEANRTDAERRALTAGLRARLLSRRRR
jgi:uncharacterized protein (DUF433 family)